MKKNQVIKLTSICMILWLIIATPFISCKAAAKQTSSERNLPPFSELNLCISANVILTQGPTQKVDIQASDRLLNLIETEVNGGKLTIKWSERFVRQNENIKIYITMVDVKSLRVSGSGDITSSGNVSASDINLAISGSGTIKLEQLKAGTIESSISGSADIIVGGTEVANNLNASISGSGNIKAPDLPVKNIDISISGSGNCYVKAQESIKARISGSGDILYSGQATIDAKVSGSGGVKHID
jgi:hypothetical protein